MMPRSAQRTFFAAALIAAVPPLAAQQTHAGALVLTGAKVFTADSLHAWAEAVAIRGARIVAVGTDAQARRAAGRGAREIALGGRVVIPGINDAHDHVGGAPVRGEFATSASQMPDPTLAEVLDSVRAVAARTPKGSWIKTSIGLRILDDSTARRTTLDRAARDHPVFLWSWWGHGAVANSAALRALAITDSAADPLGGWYERDASGLLTGRLDEYAEWGAYRRMYSLGDERRIVAAMRAFADSSLRMGVTSVQDMAGNLDPALTLRVVREARLPIRMRIIRWSIPDRTGRNEREWEGVALHPAPMVTVSGRKWVIDGTPIERNALRRTPYATGSRGRLDFPPDTIRAMLAGALGMGAAPLALHIVGDSTTDIVLGAMHALAPDSVWRPLRLRIEHGDAISTDSQIAAVKSLGIVIAQPRPGAKLRRWHDAGIPLAYGSDVLRNPFYNLMNAISGANHPDQALTREEAVTMFTRGSAYAEFTERDKGTLAPGMLADIAVLSQDIFTIPAEAFPATHSVLTIVGGKISYDELTRRRSRAARR